MRTIHAYILGCLFFCVGLFEAQAETYIISDEGRRVSLVSGNLSLSTSDFYWDTASVAPYGAANVIGGAPSEDLDLFGWSGDTYAYWGVSALTSPALYAGAFKDWGMNLSREGDSVVTLRAEEWDYLLGHLKPTERLQLLPLTGTRQGGEQVLAETAYWTATAVGTDSAKAVVLKADGSYAVETKSRAVGCAVRLARRLNYMVEVEVSACEIFEGWSDGVDKTVTVRTFRGDEPIATAIISPKEFTITGTTDTPERGDIVVKRKE